MHSLSLTPDINHGHSTITKGHVRLQVRAGEAGRKDHPQDLIEVLRQQPLPIAGRRKLQDTLAAAGFSQHIGSWSATPLSNLPPRSHKRLTFDAVAWLLSSLARS